MAHDLVKRYRITDCTRCANECATACPVYRFHGTWHPQHLAHLFLEKGSAGIERHRLLWCCVTCRACTQACPYDVDVAGFIRELRIGRTDYQPVAGGLVHTYQREQAVLPQGLQNRLSWVDGSMDLGRDGDTVLFVGCLPLFEVLFGESCGAHAIAIARSAIRVLNRLGLSPRILEDERCCGRDLYDIGDRESFEKLAEHNIAALNGSGATRVLTICPECAFTLRETYREHAGTLSFEVQHITEFIAERVDRLALGTAGKGFAFHDPCYLCRYLGVVDAPRRILSAVSTGSLVELERQRTEAPCCGAGSWVDHGPHTRAAVNERIIEAHRCGAETLVTACPKCLMLFHEVNPDCAWRQSPLVVKDLLTLVASALDEDTEA
ncbi:MAG: (Fe-S)-binding protein [bacterium]|nr:MAG: (Fe-S)-binding protein [bacterium]